MKDKVIQLNSRKSIQIQIDELSFQYTVVNGRVQRYSATGRVQVHSGRRRAVATSRFSLTKDEGNRNLTYSDTAMGALPRDEREMVARRITEHFQGMAKLLGNEPHSLTIEYNVLFGMNQK